MDRIKHSLAFKIIAIAILALLIYEAAQQLVVFFYALS